jgi:hypothetical protein
MIFLRKMFFLLKDYVSELLDLLSINDVKLDDLRWSINPL